MALKAVYLESPERKTIESAAPKMTKTQIVTI